MNRKDFCKVCNKEVTFISAEDGYFICSECGFRTSFGKYKLVKKGWGWTFENVVKPKDL